MKKKQSSDKILKSREPCFPRVYFPGGGGVPGGYFPLGDIFCGDIFRRGIFFWGGLSAYNCQEDVSAMLQKLLTVLS